MADDGEQPELSATADGPKANRLRSNQRAHGAGGRDEAGQTCGR